MNPFGFWVVGLLSLAGVCVGPRLMVRGWPNMRRWIRTPRESPPPGFNLGMVLFGLSLALLTILAVMAFIDLPAE